MDKQQTGAAEQESVVKFDLSDAGVVSEIFESTARELLYRFATVARGGDMTIDSMRKMDAALAMHLARAFMGENPEFKAVPEWSGQACADSLAAVNAELYATVKAEQPDTDDGNPRVRMVIAMHCFVRSVYGAIEKAVSMPGASRDSVTAAVVSTAGLFAAAATAPGSVTIN